MSDQDDDVFSLCSQRQRPAGFTLAACAERPPYPAEVATTRGYVMARRDGA